MKVFILGFGNMGQAIARSLKSSGGFKIYAADPNPGKLLAGKKIYGIFPDPELNNLSSCKIILVAIKPQDAATLAKSIRGKVAKFSIIISIAAGLSLKNLKTLFGYKKIVRTMPNIGILVGQGVVVWKASSAIRPGDKNLVKKFLSVFSEHLEVANEKLIDAVTAVSGSGPAYFFFFARALVDAAVSLGLNAHQSEILVRKTLAAAAELQKTGAYTDLIKRVASKKGTTETAFKVFKKKRLSSAIRAAVLAAYKRAGELSYG